MTIKSKIQGMLLTTMLFWSTASMSVELLTNGSFSAGLAGWTVTDEAGGSGSWFADAVGTTTPLSGNPTSAVGGGVGTYAVTDQGGPGTHVLTQAFTALTGTTSVSFDMFANDWSGVGPIVDPAGLTYTAGPNQYALADILISSASVFSTVASDIVTTLIAPMVDPHGSNPNPFTSYMFDISPFVTAGTSYQLRFAEVDNQLFFNQGVDNVSIKSSSSVPEPGVLFLVLLGVMGLYRKTVLHAVIRN